MTEPPATPSVVTDDEKTFASLAHALQVVGWWIAPLIIFAVKRQSKFVSFHALQALLLQAIMLIVWFGMMATWFGVFFALMFKNGQPQPNAPPPPGLFIVMPLLWLGFMAVWVLVLVAAIVYAIKAGRGEWARYPVIGNWAARLAKVG